MHRRGCGTVLWWVPWLQVGLGWVATQILATAEPGKERRKLFQEEVGTEVEEACFSRVVGMSKQGAWTKWEHVAGHKITWSDLWKAEPHHFKFLVQSVYDVLPSPANLFTWGLTDSPFCQLCQKRIIRAYSPDHIAATTLRPDMVLMSSSSKQVVLLELTVPWEDRMEEAQERKKSKYVELVAECRRWVAGALQGNPYAVSLDS